MLIENREQGQLLLDTRDQAGKSVVHYLVNPIKYGSYENIELLDVLHKAKYPLNVKDNMNKPPIFYAQEQESGVLMKKLCLL